MKNKTIDKTEYENIILRYENIRKELKEQVSINFSLRERLERYEEALKIYADFKFQGIGATWVPKDLKVGESIDEYVQKIAQDALAQR